MSDAERGSPHIGRPLADIIEDFALTRGDLAESYAREQLAEAVMASREVAALISAKLRLMREFAFNAGWDSADAYACRPTVDRDDRWMSIPIVTGKSGGVSRLRFEAGEEGPRA